ncbi:hypothetical protein BU24DRAFT_428170 [Aaosphaeria arxii CBS 175.79]|uniref:Uncharacterized protein n=1 Tax=Aaosphaeria arxii CBS 175.79 TaxID=1450172 RepID=A0A6A5XB47_9PLEO|nr:uncharacterized protein BU24DRAFT_428170 [Aaosphaeria arxii CBS 175.79]KAF2010140.1 hypothetical protein BU24DRAFT_428170 [Aaosphaeria arxii CBS 175.79]
MSGFPSLQPAFTVRVRLSVPRAPLPSPFHTSICTSPDRPYKIQTPKKPQEKNN